MTSLTAATLLAMLIGVMHRRGYAWALALGGVTPIGAALASGAVALPTFYAVALGALVGLVMRALFPRYSRSSAVPVPGGTPLVLLLLVSLAITLGAPFAFDNVYVLSPGAPSRLAAGVVTKSNIAQLIYLTLGVAVVFFLARARWAGVQIVGFTACATTLLSLWAHAHTAGGVPFPEGVFDNSPVFIFQDRLPGGAPRVRGILSEPAGLASTSLATIAYAVARLPRVRGVRRGALVVILAAASYLGAISTSATFFVAGAALLLVAGAVVGAGLLTRHRRLGHGSVALGCVAAVAAIWVLPLLSDLLADVVDDKVASASYDERSYSDSYSYELARRTLGFGVGIGSNRASSFLPSLLSTVGVVGTLLLFAAIAAILRSSWRVDEVRPAAWVLIALMVSKFISGPDLADTSGLTWTTLGVMAAAGIRATASRIDSQTAPRPTHMSLAARPGAPHGHLAATTAMLRNSRHSQTAQPLASPALRRTT